MPTSFIAQLKSHLPEEDWPRVIGALRRDALVWGSLQDDAFARQALEYCRSLPDRWSPAHLACLALDYAGLPATLQASPDAELEKKLRHLAAAALEELHSPDRDPNAPITLTAAGLAALAIRERWRMLNYSPEILTALEPVRHDFRKPIFACLIGLVPHIAELISIFIAPEAAPENQHIALHGLLANPLPSSQKSNLLEIALRPLPGLRRLALLRQVHREDAELGRAVAASFHQEPEESNQLAATKFERVQRLHEKSELLQISGHYDQAMPLLEEAWQASVKLQADLTAQLAQAAARDNDQETAIQAIEKIAQIDAQRAVAMPGFTPDHTTAGPLDTFAVESNISPHSQEEPDSPAGLLASARLALQEGHRSKAQALARQTLEASLQRQPVSHPYIENQAAQQAATPDFLQSLAEFLFSLALPAEASQAAHLALEIFPNDPQTLYLLSQASLKIGDRPKALEAAHTAAALNPSSLDLRRGLIDALITVQHWDDARQEVETLVRRSPTPAAEDLNTLTRCYLELNQPKQAAETCQKTLSLAPQDGQAHAYLGAAYRLLGDLKSAYLHFNQAIVAAPLLVSPWLALTDLHLEKGEPEKAKERLIAGSQALPQNPAIHFTLGKIYLSEGAQTKSLAELQRAAEYIANQPDPDLERQIALHLGQTLIDLGYAAEAVTTLASAHRTFPSEPAIAHLYGKSLLLSGDFGASLSALAIALQAESPPVDVHLDYGRAHLELGHHPEEGLRAIQTALQIDPQAPRGLALLAEAYTQTGDHQAALSAYQQAFTAPLVQDPHWHLRLISGFANSALASGEPELAVAKIQEAIQVSPDDLDLLKLLCRAYQMADLNQNAVNVLLDVFSRGKNNLELLLWVSDQALALDELDLAVDALNQASQLAPQKAEILVRLGYIYLEKDQQDTARETFGQLFSTDNVETEDLRLAAKALIGLGDLTSSIPYLERALELSNYQSADLLQELTEIHDQAGNYQAALAALTKHLEIAPGSPALQARKADILEKLGKPNAAAAAILEALELAPEDAGLNRQAAVLLRKCHDLAASLEHSEEALRLSPNDPEILTLAVELNLACLRTERAHQLIAAASGIETPAPVWAFWRSEIHLEKGDRRMASQALEPVLDSARTHPQLFALQARIHHRAGQSHSALKALEQALLYLGTFDPADVDSPALASIQLSVAAAAQDLGHWDVALYLGRLAAQIAETEPSPYLFLAKTYAQRAECQHFSLAVLAKASAPGLIATADYAQAAFTQSIQDAVKRAPDDEALAQIYHWRTRGGLAFNNLSLSEAANFQPKDPGDFTALIAAHRRDIQAFDLKSLPKTYRTNPAVLSQLALTYAATDLNKAVHLAGKTVDLQPQNPHHLALFAILANRAGDPSSALASIDQALIRYPHEPRWHALAAELQHQLGNFAAAIDHLEQASLLEPDHAPHFFQLGKIYLEDRSPGNAVRSLEQATRLVSSDSSYWSTLLEAYRTVNDLDQAVQCAEHLVKLNPGSPPSLILAAQVSLEAGIKPQARKHVDRAIQHGLADTEAIRQAAEILLQLDQPDRAMEILDDAIERAATPLPLLLERAKLLKTTEGPQAKLEALKSLVREHPNDSTVLAALVTGFIENDQHKKAIRTAQQAIKHAAGSLQDDEKAKLHYQLGSLLGAGGQLDQAIYHLDAAITLAPRFLDPYLEISEAYWQRRDYKNALDYFKKAIEVAPANPDAYREAGMLLKECKDYVGSEAMLRRAASLAPKDLNVQRQLGAVIALTLVHKPETAQVNAS